MSSYLGDMFSTATPRISSNVGSTAMSKLFGGSRDTKAKEAAAQVGQELGAHYGQQIGKSSVDYFRGNGFTPVKNPSWNQTATGISNIAGGMVGGAVGNAAGNWANKRYGAQTPWAGTAVGVPTGMVSGAMTAGALNAGMTSGVGAMGGGALSGLASIGPVGWILAGLTLANDKVKSGIVDWGDYADVSAPLKTFEKDQTYGIDTENEKLAGKGYYTAMQLSKLSLNPEDHLQGMKYGADAIRDVVSGGQFHKDEADKAAKEAGMQHLWESGYRMKGRTGLQDASYFLSDRQAAKRYTNPLTTYNSMMNFGKGYVQPGRTDPVAMMARHTTNFLKGPNGKSEEELAKSLSGQIKDYRQLEQALKYVGGGTPLFKNQRSFLEKVLSYKPEGYEYIRPSEIDWRL